MALPSQQQRGGGMGPRLTGGRSRRRRQKSRRVLGFVVLLAIVGVVVWQWPSIVGSGPDDAQAGNQERGTDTDSGPRAGAASLVVERTGASPLDPAGSRNTTPSSTRAADPDTNTTARRDPLSNDGSGEFLMGATVVEPSREREQPEQGRAQPQPVRPPVVVEGAGMTDVVRAVTTLAAEHLQANRPLEARDVLNLALYRDDINATDADLLRARLSELSESITFSARVYPGDETVTTYTVASGDSLSTIPRRQGYDVDYRLIQRVNNIADPSRIRLGQRLKVLTGPFHAVVDKSAFRLDLYADQTDSSGNRLFIRSFPVGLGEYGTTPVGDWVVREGAKVINPAWVNPRTGEKFDKNDPDIPIGERWIALKGTDPETELLEGYGIHGTNQPESIGMEMSMGCVRMLAPDVELMYEVLVGGKSTVRIVD